MFVFLEVHKTDPELRWMELRCMDDQHEEAVILRLVIDDPPRMMVAFSRRYMAKREHEFAIPSSQAALLEDFFSEADMARILLQKKAEDNDLVLLLPTTVIHFQQPRKTSFRKSRIARIDMFLDEARGHMKRHDFENALARLDWVLHLDPGNQMAFAYKVVCYRSWKKMAECVPVFEKWIERHPFQVEPRLGLAEMWLYLDQNKRAREVLEALIEFAPRDAPAHLALAQALLRLGEDPLPPLRKAWLLHGELARDMVEHHLDFRAAGSGTLEPMSLEEIAQHYHIPLERVLARALHGVLPAHPPEEEGGLLRFDREELDRHYHVLTKLGLEIKPARV